MIHLWLPAHFSFSCCISRAWYCVPINLLIFPAASREGFTKPSVAHHSRAKIPVHHRTHATRLIPALQDFLSCGIGVLDLRCWLCTSWSLAAVVLFCFGWDDSFCMVIWIRSSFDQIILWWSTATCRKSSLPYLLLPYHLGSAILVMCWSLF
jgi:hypothetical protein